MWPSCGPISNRPPSPPNWPKMGVTVWPFRMSRKGEDSGRWPTWAASGAGRPARPAASREAAARRSRAISGERGTSLRSG